MVKATPRVNQKTYDKTNFVIELREMTRREILSSGGYYPITVSEGVDQVIALLNERGLTHSH